MFKNYLKIGLRNLLKNKWYTLIHVLGLALGLAAFLLINQYIQFEKSYDTFHQDADQLYRLTTDNIIDGKLQVRDAMSFAPSGEALMDDLPEVLSYTCTQKIPSMVFRLGEEVIEEKGVLAVDSSFLRLFNYPVSLGSTDDLLAEPYTIVLSKDISDKYFKGANPIDQKIEILGNINQAFRVVGVIDEVPQNTHYKFDMLISLKSIQERVENDAWSGYNYYTYLLLDKRANLENINSRLPALSRKYLGDDSDLFFNLQEVKDIHLYSDFTFEPEVHGSAKAVGFLSIISFFILIIAWVNYTNLSTARAMERAKEVGLRKVVGAKKMQLISQFLTESLLINLLGAVVAIVLAQICLPMFNDLVGKKILSQVWEQPDFLQKLTIFFLLGTFIAGAYPAIALASFQPIGVLKGAFTKSKKGVFLRKALVVIQFTASLFLIASTIIIFYQIRYMTSKDLGMNIDHTIGLQNPARGDEESEIFESKYRTFVDEIMRIDGISGVASIASLPGGGSSDISSNSSNLRIVGKTERLGSTNYINTIDDRLLQALEIELLAGRNFDRAIAADSNAVIVNRAFLQKFNIDDVASVINDKIQFGNDEENPQYPIVGVVNDYNRTTLKNTVEPTMFFYRPVSENTVVKLEQDGLTNSLNQLEATWNKFYPTTPLNYSFLDQRFEKLYVEEKRFGQLFANFAILAIIVASLGLLGLAAFLSTQRTKEVGVRKVLGASIGSIIVLFFRDYLWLILMSVLIGIPLIYLSMNEWLNNYSYRIDFPWWSLFMAMFLLLVFAFITVSCQTYKVAILNPSRTIKQE